MFSKENQYSGFILNYNDGVYRYIYKYNYFMYIQNLKNLFFNLFLQKVSGIKEKCKKVMLKVGFLLIIKRFFLDIFLFN